MRGHLRALIALAALLAGCAGAPKPGPRTITPMPAPGTQQATHPKLDPQLPVLPPAGSGRGGYYQDDGPGENPPPGLAELPDAEVKAEPYAKYGNRPYAVFGKTYTPLIDEEPFVQRGVGSWYGKKFHGQRTSSGELYDMYKMTAAHPTLPIPSYARITSIESGKQVVVRINDRGPFHSSRVIDVSYTAALKLGLLGKGSHEVEIERLLPNDVSKIASARRSAAPLERIAAPPEVVALMADERASVGSPARSGFYLQLGAYARADKADEVREQIARAGMDNVDVEDAGPVHRLLGGPYQSRAAALEAAQALPAALKLKPIVVKR
ncbi:MAG: septal ring lytic transglycosylase RlpA family protein [Pseudomonadota bacterium]